MVSYCEVMIIVMSVLCSDVCECGHTRIMHDSDVVTRPDETPWSVATHTKTAPTDAFGEIQFVGSTAKPRKVRSADRCYRACRLHYHLLIVVYSPTNAASTQTKMYI